MIIQKGFISPIYDILGAMMTLSPKDSIEVTNQKKAMLDELKKSAENNALQAVQKLRAELDAIRKAGDVDRIGKLRQGGYTKDEHGQQVTLWENVLRQAERAIHSEQNSYNDWRSAMMSLLTMYSGMVKASNQASSEWLAPTFTQIKQVVRDSLAIPLKDKFLDFLKGDPKVDLPLLIHKTTLTDDNKLDLGLSSSDANEMSEELKRSFEMLVDLWLVDNGYSAKEAGPGEDKEAVKGIYVKSGTDEVLTKDAFVKLKEDEEHGLDQFLNADTKLRFQSKL